MIEEKAIIINIKLQMKENHLSIMMKLLMAIIIDKVFLKELLVLSFLITVVQKIERTISREAEVEVIGETRKGKEIGNTIHRIGRNLLNRQMLVKINYNSLLRRKEKIVKILMKKVK